MAEGHEATTSKSSSDRKEIKALKSESFELDDSIEHSNWLTVGELIRSIQIPLATHVDAIVGAFHKKLCNDLHFVGNCSSHGNSTNEKLCRSCKCWFTELKNSHKTGNNPWWPKKCNSARWFEDPWEVAKFFMSTLGSNGNRKSAKSTDLSSLLNVLERMKDEVFPGGIRVDVELVRKLRSQVRNTWAHAPKQKFSDSEKSQSFSIAVAFLNDLEKKFPEIENRNCQAYLEKLEKDGIVNVPLDELRRMKQLKINLLDDNTSGLPDRLPKFTARKIDIDNTISSIIDKGKAVVSVHGKFGIGKSAIAIEVAHILSEKHNVSVVFSHLTTATTVDEMARQLCGDVGVHDGDDPKSSLIPWLKNITNKIIFVLDGIDKLLEADEATFYEFIVWLRKKSSQHCQIVATSRKSFVIPELTTHNIQIEEMDEESCIELLNILCSGQEDERLKELAILCGKIPLAMCTAASRVNNFNSFDELLRFLRDQELEHIESPEYDPHVFRTINMSFSKCTDDERDMLLCLAIFEGSFSEEAAETVGGHKKDEPATKTILEKLVTEGWIKKSNKHRYSIQHSYKYFFSKCQSKGETERIERARAEKIKMVEYYLKLGHDLTLKTYSTLNVYKPNRDSLKNEAHHIQKVLKLCCQKDASSAILDCLAESEIYKYSARFFALLIRTIIPESIVQNFLERCAKLAEEKEQRPIKMNFDCLLIGQERKTLSRDKEFTFKMEKLKEEFEKEKKDLLERDKSLCAHYYYHQGRYLTRKARNHKENNKECLNLQIEACEMMKQSLELRGKLPDTPEGKADKVFTLLHVGNSYKIISKTPGHEMKESKSPSEKAQEYYEEAIKLSQDQLGDHELTAACHKSLGDLFLGHDNFDMAQKNYSIAKEMRENLGLNASKRHVILLTKLGISLTKLKRVNEAIEVLETALDTTKDLIKHEKKMDLIKNKAKIHKSLSIACEVLCDSGNH